MSRIGGRPTATGSAVPPAGGHLVVEHLVKTYGGLTAVDDVSLSVAPGDITALIGPNGAGKTTVFHCLTGVEQSDAGRVTLDGVDITGLRADERARRGLARTFQRLAIFGGLTVVDNLLLAAESDSAEPLLRDLVRLRHRDDTARLVEVDQVLRTLSLTAVRDRLAGELPVGQARLVEVARAWCARPKVLLLDEPASGLDDTERAALRQLLRHLAATGIAILLVEHDIELVLSVSTQIYVLQTGRLIAAGPPAQISSDLTVRAAYLGPDLA